MEDINKKIGQDDKVSQINDSERVRDDWVKPTVKRLALKDALQGPANNVQDGSGAGGKAFFS